MPAFTPTGTIYYGNVTWDNTYRHVRYFTSASDQTTWMQQHLPNTIQQGSYLYIKKDSILRVKGNADALAGVNYVMYRNTNYSTKWFYAFVTDVVYIAEDTTGFVLQTDVFQTWMGQISLNACYVERMTSPTDVVGDNVVDEPVMPLEYRWAQRASFSNDPAYIVMIATEEPVWKGIAASGVTSDHAAPVSSQAQIWGMPLPCGVYLFDYNNLGTFKLVLETYNELGIAESITDLYVLPAAGLGTIGYDPVVTTEGVTGMQVGYKKVNTASVAGFSTEQMVDVPYPQSIDGYVPHNNKMFTYPYVMVSVMGNQGVWQDYRFEEFDSSAHSIQYMWTPTPDTTFTFRPIAYAGMQNGEPRSLDMCVMVPWSYSPYLNWKAQNAERLALQMANAQKGSFESTFNTIGNAMERLSGTFEPGAYSAAGKRLGEMARPVDELIEGIVAPLLGMTNERAAMKREYEVEQAYHRRLPSEIRGSTSGWGQLISTARQTFIGSRTCTAAQARQMDEFFTMYGYAQNRIMTPNMTSRTRFNYVKCGGSNATGNIPKSDLALINEAFDAGVTYWHVDDMYDYTSLNTIR